MRALAAFFIFAAAATPAFAQGMPSATGFYIQAYGGLRIPDNLQFDGTAQDLGIGQVLVPRASPTFSALGTLVDQS